MSSLPAITARKKGSLIDEWLPDYDFVAAYRIRIRASPQAIYRQLLVCDFNSLWLVRVLLTLRTGKLVPRNRQSGDLRRRLQGTGFPILEEVPDREIVIGVAGRFWRPDGGRYFDLEPSNFAEFSRPGFAKAAWNFELEAETAETTLLSTETRIQCFGRAALRKFRFYWALVGPFSGLIRDAILKQVKKESEAAALTLAK